MSMETVVDSFFGARVPDSAGPPSALDVFGVLLLPGAVGSHIQLLHFQTRAAHQSDPQRAILSFPQRCLPGPLPDPANPNPQGGVQGGHGRGIVKNGNARRAENKDVQGGSQFFNVIGAAHLSGKCHCALCYLTTLP